MSSQVSFDRTLACAGALTRYTLLKQDSNGKWAACGAGDIADAVCPMTVDATYATDGGTLAGRLLHGGRTELLTASAAITSGDDVYSAASGKVNSTKTGFRVGVARQTVTADGDIIEVELRPDYTTWFAKTAAVSTSIAATTADTAYDTSITIPASVLRAGSFGRITAKVNIPTTTGAETLLIKVKMYDGTNTVTVFASAAIDVVDADIAYVTGYFELPTATTLVSGALGAVGTLTAGTARAGGVLSSTYAPTAATTVTVTQTASNTGETSALQSLMVEIRR